MDKLNQIKSTNGNGYSQNVSTSLVQVFGPNPRRRLLVLNSSTSTGLFYQLGADGNGLALIFVPQSGAPVIVDFARFGTLMQEAISVKTSSGTFSATLFEVTDSGDANPSGV